MYRTHPPLPRRQSLKQNQNDDDGPASMLEEGDEQEDGTAAGASDDGEAPENTVVAGYTYRVPRGCCVGGVGGTTYIVDRTPDEVAQGLLSASNDDEEGGEGGADENETGSATDEENEMREEEGGSQGGDNDQEPAEAPAAAAAAAAGDKKKPGSAGGGKGKGKAAAAPTSADAAAAAMADIPRYWRGRFAPLADEDLQTLELEKGEEGLEEYFDKRYVVVGRGWGSPGFRFRYLFG